jgi:hypothetical protein
MNTVKICSSRRELALTLYLLKKNEPTHVGCYESKQ